MFLAACSSSSAPRNSPLSLASSYHLRLIDGVPLPISQSGGGTIDSGHVRRLGGDTIYIDQYSHIPASAAFPGTVTIAHGTWLATESGNMVVLHPLLATEQDTAFVGMGDTLTLHLNAQMQIYVAP